MRRSRSSLTRTAVPVPLRSWSIGRRARRVARPLVCSTSGSSSDQASVLAARASPDARGRAPRRRARAHVAGPRCRPHGSRPRAVERLLEGSEHDTGSGSGSGSGSGPRRRRGMAMYARATPAAARARRERRARRGEALARSGTSRRGRTSRSARHGFWAEMPVVRRGSRTRIGSTRGASESARRSRRSPGAAARHTTPSRR